jgi:hypothetical protein
MTQIPESAFPTLPSGGSRTYEVAIGADAASWSLTYLRVATAGCRAAVPLQGGRFTRAGWAGCFRLGLGRIALLTPDPADKRDAVHATSAQRPDWPQPGHMEIVGAIIAQRHTASTAAVSGDHQRARLAPAPVLGFGRAILACAWRSATCPVDHPGRREPASDRPSGSGQ